MAVCLQIQACTSTPPDLHGGYDSDYGTDEPGSPVYSDQGGGDGAQLDQTNTTQAPNAGFVTTQFLTANEGRHWDGTGRRMWYRTGSDTIVHFAQGPDVSWPIEPREMDTRFVYQQVQLEADKHGDHDFARLQ